MAVENPRVVASRVPERTRQRVEAAARLEGRTISSWAAEALDKAARESLAGDQSSEGAAQK